MLLFRLFNYFCVENYAVINKNEQLEEELDDLKFDIEKNLSSAEELKEAVKNSTADFGFVFMEENEQKYVLLSTEISDLAVSRLQPALDEFINSEKAGGKAPEIDYIHGDAEVMRLGSSAGATGILLPPVAKDSFFGTISSRGPLPRKSFSMGEADEKRFYLEARRIEKNA